MTATLLTLAIFAMVMTTVAATHNDATDARGWYEFVAAFWSWWNNQMLFELWVIYYDYCWFKGINYVFFLNDGGYAYHNCMAATPLKMEFTPAVYKLVGMH